MPNTVEHEPLVAPHPDALTVRYTTNPDGWVTAQLVEVPEAISQGRDDAEAFANVLAALYDLTHVPTGAERIANTIQARLIEPVFALLRR
jgi:ABC-type hemin transport system substrate-binding protein